MSRALEILSRINHGMTWEEFGQGRGSLSPQKRSNRPHPSHIWAHVIPCCTKLDRTSPVCGYTGASLTESLEEAIGPAYRQLFDSWLLGN